MNMFIPLVSFRTVEPDLVGWKYTEARFSIPFGATADTWFTRVLFIRSFSRCTDENGEFVR